MVRVRINGKEIEGVETVMVRREEASNAEAWSVVLLGVLAMIGWWRLWQ